MSEMVEPIHERLRLARRQQGITQSELARETACSQSAISMFESGRTDALSRKMIARLAQRLDVTLASESLSAGKNDTPTSLRRLMYCPIDDCPSNIPYVVRGQLHFKPTLIQAPSDQAMHCVFCGEMLEDRCPNESCGAPLVEGGACFRCGGTYVTATRVLRGPIDTWVHQRRDEIRELWTMSRSQSAGA